MHPTIFSLFIVGGGRLWVVGGGKEERRGGGMYLLERPGLQLAHIFPWLVLVSIMKLRKEPRACAQRVSGD